MTKGVSLFVFLAVTLLVWIAPAASQQGKAQIVHINVIVTDRLTNDPLNGLNVSYDEGPSDCNGQHHEHVAGRTSRGLIGQGGGEGEAALSFITCTGPATITVNGGSQFDSQTKEIQIVEGQAVYNVFIKLESKGRVVHIRVQGRDPNGALVPVPSAVVVDRSGNQIAETDSSGSATGRVKEAMGETVTLRAEAPHWRPGSASYIVGAYHSGSRLTRSEDYVNIVLGEEEHSKQEIALQIMVQGNCLIFKSPPHPCTTNGGSRVPIEHALIYDENGHYLTSTDSRGHAVAVVEQALGETFRLKAEAQHWTPETLSLLARAETRTALGQPPGSRYLYQQVRFTLRPATNQVGDLVIEVLDRNTDKPVPAATVRLYKPTGFPGTLMGVETTNHQGEVTFDDRHIESALVGQETRVGVQHGGYETAVQTVARSLTTAELPRYVVYLKPKTENTKWSGTWVQGPYTIHISGGSGSLGYNALRSEGAGGCCPLVDQSGGNCEVIGSKAICQYHGQYSDSAKIVQYGGHGTLTLSGDYIQYDFTQVTGTITLKSGQPCPDITQCTGLHPGANFTGTWTRKKQ